MELASLFGNHLMIIHQWMNALLEGTSEVVKRGGIRAACKNRGAGLRQRFFGKKAQTVDREVRRRVTDRDQPDLTAGKQCKFLSLSRSSFYYETKGETDLNLDLMCKIEKRFLETPFYGARHLTWHLHNEGPLVNEKRNERYNRTVRGEWPGQIIFETI